MLSRLLESRRFLHVRCSTNSLSRALSPMLNFKTLDSDTMLPQTRLSQTPSCSHVTGRITCKKKVAPVQLFKILMISLSLKVNSFFRHDVTTLCWSHEQVAR